ncbi:hypothetical protein PMIT1313_02329 [Prochlorococcus marinus str. MIT 1313]|nr:hypothetical protein PMIT1313_02329 [Prochlorococcus marinus str. MIT 1313]KZR71059.1 hypothetical protein PMIT1318_02201 [Prochlorococcus marinus str. MIT 1318]
MQAQKIEARSFEEFIDVEQDDLSVAKSFQLLVSH